MIWVRRSSPYLSTISVSSSATICRCRDTFARMSSRSAISSSILARSSMIFWRSSAASRRSCMSRIALAWISSISRSSISPRRASSTSGDRRISAITSSSWSSALTRPRRTWARFSASRSRNSVRRRMTSTWWVTQLLMNWSIESVRGTPSTSASMLALKLVCSSVCLRRLLRTTRATASRLSTTTSRWPVRSEVSSRTSEMPCTLPESASSAIFSARLSGLTM